MANYTNAPRKALLAFFPSERQHEELERAKTVLSPQAFQKLVENLKQTAAEGVSHDRGETTPGIYGMAAPVYDATGQVRAALGVIAPADWLPPEKKAHCLAELKKAAQRISQRLGYQGSFQHP
jgi:DNA-binding IclR family transcriptional regulator